MSPGRGTCADVTTASRAGDACRNAGGASLLERDCGVTSSSSNCHRRTTSRRCILDRASMT